MMGPVFLYRDPREPLTLPPREVGARCHLGAGRRVLTRRRIHQLRFNDTNLEEKFIRNLTRYLVEETTWRRPII